MLNQSHKAYLKECVRKLESTKRQRTLSQVESEALDDLYDQLDSHQAYLNESGQAYE